MKEDEFKHWLKAGGANTEAGRNSRTHAVKTIERKLAELGSSCTDLDEAWALDRFEHLRQRLREIRQDAQQGGSLYRVLMPASEKPLNRLSNWNSWLAQYGRCLGGDVQNSTRDADRIRQYVLEHYIEPAREAEQDYVEVLVSDVNGALSLNSAWPNICQALSKPKFQELAQVPPPERIGADQSSATVFRFTLSASSLSDAEILARFDKGQGRFRAIRANWDSEVTQRFCRLARLVHLAGLDWWHVAIHPYQIRFGRDEPGRKRAISVLGSVEKNDPYAWINHEMITPFGGTEYLSARNFDAFLDRLEENSEKLRAWLPPKSDRQGYWPDELGIEMPTELPDTTTTSVPEPNSTNLILYGPPGTGKTYATAEAALRICGEDPPEDRQALMEVYRRLSDAKRIEFVTFHQSMSYEDFVEGRQPVTGDDEDGVGFHLETVPGIFRRIARRAETSRGHATGLDALTVDGRQIFKTSIGDATDPADAHLFEEAIAGGYTLLGFDDADWSDEKYTDRNEIIRELRERGEVGELNAQTARIQMPHIFRNWVKKDDILIVSKGTGLFRAIGVVEGGYEFHSRLEGGYAHRRTVRWLWVDREGVPISEIYERKFSMRTIYLMTKAEVNVPALERYMNSQRPEAHGPIDPEPFVLIIDEINRANISKVFGELITLLEPDKRLGQVNQLKVRLPYSEDEFGVPANLHIIGTMNTADRSIALLDTALRRRFEFRELMPDPSVLGVVDGLDLGRLLTTLNDRIEYLFDREHQIGHAYFVNCRTRQAIDETMRHKVIPLLAEYFYEDWGKVAAVLGDAAPHENAIKGGFLNREVLTPPPGLDGDGGEARRFRWSIRAPSEGFDYAALVGA